MPVKDYSYDRLLAGTPYNNIVIVGAENQHVDISGDLLLVCIND
jgi:hypothetical protein